MNSEFNQKKNDYERMLNEKESENITLKNDNRYYLNQIDQFKTEKVMQDERFRNVSLENDELRKQIQDIKESSSAKEDEKEKEYLSAVIKPFKDRVCYIQKVKTTNSDNQFIFIRVKRYDCEENEDIDLPYFKANTMYKGMKVDRCYTLKELGL